MTAPVVGELDPPRASPLPRVLGALVALLLVAGVVAAATVDGRQRSAKERFEAVSAAVAAESFAYEVTYETSPEGSALAGLDVTTTGVAAPQAKRLRSVSRSRDPQALAEAMTFIADGDDLYIHAPAGFGRLGAGAGKPWIRFRRPATAPPAGGGVSAAGEDPLARLRQLRAVDTEIETIGREDVRGVPTTHYRARLDLTEGAPAGPETDAVLRDVEVDVWLDDQDRARRHRQTIALPDVVGGGSMTMTFEAFDFGEPVTIDLPPADQVRDIELGPEGMRSLFQPEPAGS